jgi:hypothetical protein
MCIVGLSTPRHAKHRILKLFPGLWHKAIWATRRGDPVPAELGICNRTSKHFGGW